MRKTKNPSDWIFQFVSKVEILFEKLEHSLHQDVRKHQVVNKLRSTDPIKFLTFYTETSKTVVGENISEENVATSSLIVLKE